MNRFPHCLLVVWLGVGCAQQTGPNPTPAPVTPRPEAVARTATPAPSSPIPTAPLSTRPGGPTGAIQGVPSRRRGPDVQAKNRPESVSKGAGKLVPDDKLPPQFRGQKVYQFIEGGRVILKTEDGIILSVQPIP